MQPKKILIVDDEPDVVEYLSVILETNGYKAYSASDIRTAESLVNKIIPDLICLDIVMPNETGISFYIKLQQEDIFKNIPVIIISGIVESEEFDFRSYVKNESIPAPKYFMEKPLKIDAFLKNVKMLTKK